MTPEQQAVVSRAGDLSVPLEDVTAEALALFPTAGLAVRPQQLQMAQLVARTLDQQFDEARGTPSFTQHRAGGVEAPCGSGKGLAYLIPGVLAVIRSRMNQAPTAPAGNIVISTANIALQRQLVEVDVPLVERVLGVSISAGQLKGLANYICEDQATLAEAIHPAVRDRDTTRLLDWYRQGGSGDRDEVPFQVSYKAWRQVAVDASHCLGEKCKHVMTCLGRTAKQQAMQASVLVVNHAYLSLATKTVTERALGVIIDEAHEMEDTARTMRSATLTASSVNSMAKRLEKYLSKGDSKRWVEMFEPLLNAASGFVPGRDNSETLQEGWLPGSAGAQLLEDIDEVKGKLIRVKMKQSDEMAQQRVGVLIKSLARQALHADVMLSGTNDDHCVWVDRDYKDRVRISTAPVHARIAAQVKVPTVLTSATLGRPDRSALQLGWASTEVASLPSPWPLQEMGVAIVPRTAPTSGRDRLQFLEEAVVRYACLNSGGILVLATSNYVKKQLARYLRAGTAYQVRVQGEAGRSELLDWFKHERDGILVGTRSLFQGVDIPGDSLRGVFLDKIPFPPPSPLEEAIADSIKAKGGNPFMERSVAKAADDIRQVAGRLLRSASDRGSVVVADSRLLTARYGGVLLKALSPFPISNDLADARRILDQEPLEGVTVSKRLAAPRRSS